MTINTQITPQEMTQMNYKIDEFNSKLKESQKIVSKNSLGEADFMKLLITQLKSQDPTKPLDDKEFIGQMAQFTSLKQMNELTDNIKNLTKEFSFTKAVGLVNKTVSWTDDNGKSGSGIVQSIKVKNGDTFINIDGNDIMLNQVQEVRDTLNSNKTSDSGSTDAKSLSEIIE